MVAVVMEMKKFHRKDVKVKGEEKRNKVNKAGKTCQPLQKCAITLVSRTLIWSTVMLITKTLQHTSYFNKPTGKEFKAQTQRFLGRNLSNLFRL